MPARLPNGYNGRYPAGRPAVCAGVPGACVGAGAVVGGGVAGAEPGDPAEAAGLVPVDGALVPVLPQPQITTLVIVAAVSRAVMRKW